MSAFPETSSGLNPSGGFALPDVDDLDAGARSLRQHADDFLTDFCTTTALWRQLSTSYKTDESASVLVAFDHLTPTAQRVQSTATASATALETFSTTCRDLKLRLAAYSRAVHTLDADISVYPTSVEVTHRLKDDEITITEHRTWNGDADLSDRRARLAADIKAIHEEYLSAQNTCAASLAEVSGGTVYTARELPRVDLRSGSVVDEILYDAGTTLGVDHPEPEPPWGRATVPYRPHDALGFIQGFGAGAIELVDGVWSFVGTGNDTKFELAWGGVGALASAALTVNWAKVNEGFRKEHAEEVAQAEELLGSLGPALIHTNEHATNPNWAAGQNMFTVASAFVGYGAGAAIKSGTVFSKAGAVAGRMSIAAMESAKYEAFAARLAASSHILLTAGDFLAKPGSLALKVSDILAPATTAKVQAALTKASVGAWKFAGAVPTAAGELVTGAKHATAEALTKLADGVRAADAVLPKAAFPDAHGTLTHTHTGLADGLEAKAAKIREDNPTAFTPSHRAEPDTPRSSFASTMETRFPKPGHVTDTVTLRHGDPSFPIHRKENFAARTNLKPNTEYIVENRRVMKGSDGNVDVPSLEKYYTDETGHVTRVDTYAGVRGAWSPELNKPTPNVTYNVIAEVDGGLRNTFTLVMDQYAHLASAKGHVVSTLVGNSNRNGYQQWKAGRLGGPGYDGGHASPSALGFIGEKAGLFPQHQWQNRGAGLPNDEQNFHDVEMKVINNVKTKLTAGDPVDLTWEMELVGGDTAGVPASTRLTYAFGADERISRVFNNLPADDQDFQ
ncbi:hypothetical protein ACIPWF_13055 [Paenarthrobacter sp. NPDC089989]|uniref:hypothetical protein n=1 Tax=unclassified Paenarthrobacter TaxID=2634190 RepID=UPI0037FDF1FD